MGQFLKYLTAEDERKLLGASHRTAYERNSLILKEGEQRHAIFLIRKGMVRIELEHPEFNIEITRLVAGEIFGEMSYLEGHTVSAHVIAQEPSEIDAIEARAIDALAEEDLGFQARFYKSLAEILSHRLRDTTLRGFG